MARILDTVLPESIRNEGMLFVPQILEDLMRGKLDREFPVKLEEGEDPATARTYAFDVARRLYKTFSDSLTQSNYKVVTRRFILNLLNNALGWKFDRDLALADSDSPFLVPPFDPAILDIYTPSASTSPLSHSSTSCPVITSPHICSLDESNARFHGWGLSSASRSATRFAQEFVNTRDEWLWAIVSNGRELRLVRDNPSLTRPSFLSFDLNAILSGQGDFAAFAFLWRMLHASRVPHSPAPHSLFWETLHSRSAETGVRALNGLRAGVVTAIEVLGTGFLRRNPAIREALQSGELSVQDYEQELLRLAYRFLFLFVAEERRLLHAPGTSDAVKKVYREGYSMARLRRIAARYAAGSSDRHIDLYEGVRRVFAGLEKGEPRLGLTALGGIFREGSCPHLKDAALSNADLIAVMRSLRYIDAGKKLFPVNYRDMGAEEFGSVYEGILELVPNYTASTQQLTLIGAAGNNRKTTGSYYTPSSLVDKQIESALDPLLERAMRSSDPEKAILELDVIDTSCGSGHFVVAAARRMASQLVAARGVETSPAEYQRALRDVVRNSIYGVDINPLAVELAKITLWIESVVPGEPLTFLDSRFVCGDATLGIDNLNNLNHGIPAAAYKPLPGDEKEAAQELNKFNRQSLKEMKEDAAYSSTFFTSSKTALSDAFREIEKMPEENLEEIDAKKAAFEKFRESTSFNGLVQAANLFTAAFLMPKTSVEVPLTDLFGTELQMVKKPDPTIPTTTNLLAVLNPESPAYQKPSDEMLARATEICAQNKVLHWPLVFPTVFEKGGFDCILTNPPWDQLQVSEEEFFAPRDSAIAELLGSKRKAAILKLQETNPILWEEFQKALIRQSRLNSFISGSARFPLSAHGKLNLYSVITETILHVRNKEGRAGFIVPTGICTDDSNKALFASMVESKSLVSLYDFENAASGKRLFDAVHPQFKIALLSLGPAESADFAFFMGHPTDLADERRHFSLTADEFSLINPNTKTMPTFRSKGDAELAKKIYLHVGVLLDETRADGNPWGLEFKQGLFNMTTASSLFVNLPGEDDCPLFEAKLIHQFDHRWATYETSDQSRDVTLAEKRKEKFEITPRYWINCAHVKTKLRGYKGLYLFGWRNIARTTDIRTFIATVIPCVGVGHSMPLYWTSKTSYLDACLLADFNSIVHDWIVRQKLGGTNLTYGYVYQIATLSPSAYSQADIDFIVPRVLELTYTSYSLKGWAEALGYEGEPFVFDPERRAILRAELDARYAKLYGLNEQELTYILDPSAVYGEDYPSESFRVLKEKEIAEFGEYRTMRMILEARKAQETPFVVGNDYKRGQSWDDSRSTYLRFLVGQMIAQSPTHQMPLTELFAAFSALRTPKEMSRRGGMPNGVGKWAREYKDAIRDDESLERVLMQMFDAGEISISKSGMVSYVDEGSLHAADHLVDVVMDARMALAFMRLDITQERVDHIRTAISPEFFRRVMEGAYARAA